MIPPDDKWPLCAPREFNAVSIKLGSHQGHHGRDSYSVATEKPNTQRARQFTFFISSFQSRTEVLGFRQGSRTPTFPYGSCCQRWYCCCFYHNFAVITEFLQLWRYVPRKRSKLPQGINCLRTDQQIGLVWRTFLFLNQLDQFGHSRFRQSHPFYLLNLVSKIIKRSLRFRRPMVRFRKVKEDR